MHPRVALVAAAALILVAVGIRYLGDTRWNGRRLILGGAQLLVTSDGDRFQAVVEGVHDVSEGDLVLVLPGPEARFDLPDGGRVHLPAPALIALDEHDGRPRILLARGYLQVDSQGGPPVLVNAAGREFEVHGVAEFTVAKTSRANAFEWASQVLPRTESASFLPSAWAASRLPAEVVAHSREGSVVAQTGERIFTGQLSTWQNGPRGTPPVRVGGRTALRPTAEILDPEESRVLRALLQETGGDIEDLARALDGESGPPPCRACLAAWLLGELGHPDGTEPLRRVIRDVPLRSSALRSAATASLIRLVDDKTANSLWRLVADPQDAVAETVLIRATQARLGEVVTHLSRVFDDETLSPARRVLAAALLQEEGYPVPDALLVGFLMEEDTSVAALAARTLGRHEKGPAHLARVLHGAGDGLATLILEALTGRPFPAAEEDAREALARTTGKTDARSRELFAAALRFLGRIRAEGLDDVVRRTLREGDSTVKAAALACLDRNTVSGFRSEVESILRSPAEPASLRLAVLRKLEVPIDVLEDLRDDPDPEVRANVRAWLLSSDAAGRRGDLARSSLAHPRPIVRREAWAWLGRHAPRETVERAGREWSAHAGFDAVVFGLREVCAFLEGRSEGESGLRDETASLFDAVIRGTTDDPATKGAAFAGLRDLTHGAGSTAPSARAREIFRGLAMDTELPRDLRLKAARTLARLAEDDREFQAIEDLLAGDDEGLSAAVAKNVTTRRPLPSAPVVRRLRRVTVHLRARARLALCTPFDAGYAAAVLDSGNADAVAIVLRLLEPGEVPLVRDSVQPHRESDSPAIRILAIRCLRRGDDPSEIPSAPDDDDPWVRIAVAASQARITEPFAAALRVVGSDAIEGSLVQVLEAFKEAPGPDTGRALLERMDRCPPALEAIARADQNGPPPAPDRLLHDVKRRNRRRTGRKEALARLEPGASPASLTQAAAELADYGGRADLPRLFRIAADETHEQEVRRTAVRAAADLLGRHVDATEPGPALSVLRAWWSERTLALPVPVPPR